MRRAAAELMRRFGQEVDISSGQGDSRTGWAFVQPILARRKDEPQFQPTALGWAQRRRYRYLGTLPLACGDQVTAIGRRFSVAAAEPVYLGSELSHWWALLEIADEEENCT